MIPGFVKVSDAIVANSAIEKRRSKTPTYALSLDGVSGYVGVPDNDNLEGMSTLTINIKFKTSMTLAIMHIISKWTQGVSGVYTIRDSTGSGLVATAKIGGAVKSSTPAYSSYNNNVDRIATLRYDGGNLELLIDNANVSNIAVTGSLGADTRNVRIGAADNGSFFQGLVYETQIIAQNLTDAQLINMNNGSVLPTQFDCRLWHNYRLGHARDLSGYGNNGTLNGNAQFIEV